MSTPKPLSPQDKFDSIMQHVLETVSGNDYLKYYGIYRSDPVKTPAKWHDFMVEINKQTETLKPGLYPRTIKGQEVHYYALRKESNGIFTLANGYSDAGGAGSTYGRPLRAQPNHSHGLCQTFALMYYEKQSDRLIPGAYQQNVLIGLEWLEQYTANYDWVFPYEDEKIVYVIQLNEKGQNVRKKETTSLKKILNWPASMIYKKELRLHDLLVWLLAPQHRPLLNAWAADLK